MKTLIRKTEESDFDCIDEKQRPILMYMWIASLGVRSVAGVARCVREVMVERRAGGGGSCWGRTVLLLLLLALAVLCCAGETTGGSPRHHTSLATDILARYPGQDDYISRCSSFPFFFFRFSFNPPVSPQYLKTACVAVYVLHVVVIVSYTKM